MAVSTQPVKPTGVKPPQENGVIPPLENGDRLTRAEFERRYDAMQELKKAELIEGEVFMPSPVRHGRHSHPHTDHLLRSQGKRRADLPEAKAGEWLWQYNDGKKAQP